jgi:hypothetical protein
MAKKSLLVLILAAAVATGSVFSQEQPGGISGSIFTGGMKNGTGGDSATQPAETGRSWFSLEATILGGGLRYEKSISENVSWTIDAFYNNDLIFMGESAIGASIGPRVYLGPLYIGANIGLGWTGWEKEEYSYGYYGYSETVYHNGVGFMLEPTAGLKLGGKTNKVFISPFFSLPIILVDGQTLLRPRFGIGIGGAQ